MRLRPALVLTVGCVVAGGGALRASTGQDREQGGRGREVYARACAACHGSDGRGAPRAMASFDVPLPDLGDCRFTTREPNHDWSATTHEGGPARGFDRMMPAFGSALRDDEVEAVLRHVRTLCRERGWPRGELNLPRPLVTEKAFPEDEAVLESQADTGSTGSILNVLSYERRLGPRTQWEIALPYQVDRLEAGGTNSGIGDVSAGFKRALYDSLERGSILSVTAELILPSGQAARGFGRGTPAFEPFLSFGQILPASGFLQLQLGAEITFDAAKAPREAYGRLVLGKSFVHARFGRMWSPMVELVAARELRSGERVLWDLVPQLQVTLSARQHVRFDVGLQLPVNEKGRPKRVLAYVLWDWFDGGLLQGW